MATTAPARRVSAISDINRGGDYYLSTYLDEDDVERKHLWFLLPMARDVNVPAAVRSIHRVYEPKWTITEFPDGSIEVRASIACGRGTPDGEYFHGFLDRGNVWRIL